MTLSLIRFAAVVVISYFGLLAGLLLARFTREELPTARKFFPWLQRLIIIVAAAVAMNFLNFNLATRLAVYFALVLLIAVRLNTQLFYALFGIAIFAAAKEQNVLLFMSSLVFLFGLVSGSQGFVRKSFAKNVLLLLAKNSVYFIAILLFAFQG